MRLGSWVVFLTGFMIFLSLLGFQTGMTNILESLGINIGVDSSIVSANIESSTLWDKLFGGTGILVILAGSGLASIIIGLYGKGYDVSLVIAPLCVFIAELFASTFYYIIKLIMSYQIWWMTGIITIIFGAMSFGFIMSCVDYFAGR